MATDYYQVNVRFICAGQPAEIVLHYRIIDPSNSDEWVVANQLGAAISEFNDPTDWLSRLLNLMSNEAWLSSIRIKRVAPTGGNTASDSWLPDERPGNVEAEIDAQQVAACVIWCNETTADKTGRTFIPGISTDSTDQSRWPDAYITNVNLFIAKHLTGFTVTAGIFEPVIFDRTAKTGLLMTSGYLTPRIGTQRRREVPV